MQKHRDGSRSFFPPSDSANIVRCGSKTCSSRRIILIHHLYMKLLEPPQCSGKFRIFFFNFILGEKPRSTSPQKAKGECTRRNICPSATLFTTNPTRNNPIADGERRYTKFRTSTHNSLSTVDVVQF